MSNQLTLYLALSIFGKDYLSCRDQHFIQF